MGKVHLLHNGVANTFGWSPRNERFHASFSAPLRTVKCAARQLHQLARADDGLHRVDQSKGIGDTIVQYQSPQQRR
jgi:hypothetical protein